MLSQANLGGGGGGGGGGGRAVTDILISGSTKKDCIFQWMRSFLTNSLNSWLAKHIVIHIAQQSSFPRYHFLVESN